MKTERITINGIPALVWGEKSERVCLCVHGKMGSKEAAEYVAAEAEKKGMQTLSFDLPQHGGRVGEKDRCDIWNGVRDLTLAADYAFANWSESTLFACSLGAYFSLHAFGDRPFRKALFQSPVVDMEYLVRQMMVWFDVSEARLEREKEIETPVDLLRWDYYRYILAHPVTRWSVPTAILFGAKDDLQTREIMESFSERHGCALTVSPRSSHPFMEAADGPIVAEWLQNNL